MDKIRDYKRNTLGVVVATEEEYWYVIHLFKFLGLKWKGVWDLTDSKHREALHSLKKYGRVCLSIRENPLDHGNKYEVVYFDDSDNNTIPSEGVVSYSEFCDRAHASISLSFQVNDDYLLTIER